MYTTLHAQPMLRSSTVLERCVNGLFGPAIIDAPSHAAGVEQGRKAAAAVAVEKRGVSISLPGRRSSLHYPKDGHVLAGEVVVLLWSWVKNIAEADVSQQGHRSQVQNGRVYERIVLPCLTGDEV